jgi:hypothetical protein
MPLNNRIEIPLNLSAIGQALEQPLAFVEPEERRAEIRSYLAAARLHLERAVYDALTAAVASVDGGDTAVKARVEYRPDGPLLVIELAEEAEPDVEAPFIEGDLEKVTIRLPGELKAAIDRLADDEHISANSVYIRELGRTIARSFRDAAREAGRGPRGNRRSSLRGFVGKE